MVPAGELHGEDKQGQARRTSLLCCSHQGLERLVFTLISTRITSFKHLMLSHPRSQSQPCILPDDAANAVIHVSCHPIASSFRSSAHREDAAAGRYPEVGAARVEDHPELLRRGPNPNGAVVLRVGEVGERDDAGGGLWPGKSACGAARQGGSEAGMQRLK